MAGRLGVAVGERRTTDLGWCVQRAQRTGLLRLNEQKAANMALDLGDAESELTEARALVERAYREGFESAVNAAPDDRYFCSQGWDDTDAAWRDSDARGALTAQSDDNSERSAACTDCGGYGSHAGIPKSVAVCGMCDGSGKASAEQSKATE